MLGRPECGTLGSLARTSTRSSPKLPPAPATLADMDSTEEERRKARSERLLESVGTTINPGLPAIESVTETRLRSAREAGQRTIVLLAVAAIAADVDRSSVLSWLKSEGLWTATSARERRLLEHGPNDERERIRASWLVECAVLLGWALHLLDDLGLPTGQHAPRIILEHVPGPGQPTAAFLDALELRPVAVILDMADVLYRAHWATRYADRDACVRSGPLDGDVAMEWHRAVNWLTRYGDEDDWDLVATDT